MGRMASEAAIKVVKAAAKRVERMVDDDDDDGVILSKGKED